MKKQRVLVLVREGHVPPESIDGMTDEQIAPWKAEFDVVSTLQERGHTARALGVYDDIGPIRRQLQEYEPNLTFMLLEEFHGVVEYDHAIVSYLELMRQPYTGCNPRGLLLSRDKALSKKILAYHRIPTPRFAVFPVGRKPKRPNKLQYPLIVKSATEDASLGISQASIVNSDEALVERVRFVHKHTSSDAIAEQYIDGREIYVSVMGNRRLTVFPPWEMVFAKMPDNVHPIATAKVKWDTKYQEKHGIDTKVAELGPELATRVVRICKRVYRALHMSGYGRMDLRVTDDGRVYVLEANANPNIEYGEDFAESAEKAGVGYGELLEKIMSLGLRYRAAWKG
ncbi:MAG: ATP-grasp domain-containing protein [Deltaproteobacteria bacterium]|jgi:D-alanine-D-alanine ligase